MSCPSGSSCWPYSGGRRALVAAIARATCAMGPAVTGVVAGPGTPSVGGGPAAQAAWIGLRIGRSPRAGTR